MLQMHLYPLSMGKKDPLSGKYRNQKKLPNIKLRCFEADLYFLFQYYVLQQSFSMLLFP